MKTRIHKANVTALETEGFKVCYWEDFDYSILKYIQIRQRQGRSKSTYADCIIMADTETSKKTLDPKTDADNHNHVCAWSIAFRAYGMNLAVLWGKKPSDFPRMLRRVLEYIGCDEVKVFFHNLSYDWIFLRKFMMREFGKPKNQLNVKPLYPLSIRFDCGLHLLDSLLLAQRSLQKWCEDMNVEHQKAVGSWDYDLIRDQKTWNPTDDELLYICNDVLGGVECIDATLRTLHKTLGSLPMTATGIVRTECREAGRKYHAWDWATKILPLNYEEIQLQEKIYHGGYTHGNRNANTLIWPNKIDPTPSQITSCLDFASSYPFLVITEKMPMERFWSPGRESYDPSYIFDNMEEYAFIFKITCKGVRLKDPHYPMPVISYSKCDMSIDEIEDNGRIMRCGYLELWLNEIDFKLVYDLYDFDYLTISDLTCAKKDYLPKWLTDYTFQRFIYKTQLKGVDAVQYAIEKAKLNSIYGMSAQKCVKPEIEENYETGEYAEKEGLDLPKLYEKYLKNRNTFLPYCIGAWVTSAAQRNLFRLGSCVPDGEIWLYSDTDSVYATGFDMEKVGAYNQECKDKLIARGYGPVHHKGKDYWLGVAELDGESIQFTALHAKCYCKRKLVARGDNFVMGEDYLSITVAGVPKAGAVSLGNHIENFKEGFLFPGEVSGKKQHTHYFIDEIYIDENGNEVGDSIDLTPGDYIIKNATDADFDIFENEEVNIIDYEQSAED